MSDASALPPVAPTQDPIAPPAPPIRPFSALDAAETWHRDQQAAQDAQLAEVFHAATMANPDEEARAQKLAARLQVPRTALPSLDVAQRQQRIKDLEELRAANPRLDGFMRNLPTVRMLHDDTGGLKLVSGTFDWWKRNVQAGSGVNESGFLRAKQAMARANGGDLSMLDKDRLDELDRIQQMAGFESGAFSEALKMAAQFAAPLLTSTAVGGAAAGAASLGGPVSAATAFTYGTGASLFAHSAVVEFGHQYQTIYDQLTEAGVPPDDAHNTAMWSAGGYALGAAALDLLGVTPAGRAGKEAVKAVGGRILGLTRPTKAMAGAEFLKTTSKSILSEAGTEGAQDLLGAVAQNIAGNLRGVDTGPTVGDALLQAASTMWQTTKGMAVLAPIAPAAHFMSDMKKAQKAQDSQVLFQKLADAKKDVKLAERAPDVYAQIVDALAPDEDANVHVAPAKLLAALKGLGMTREQLAAKLPAVEKQLSTSERTGDDVAISLGDFAAHVAGTPLHDALRKSLRIGDGFSLDQAEAWAAEIEANRAAVSERIAKTVASDVTWHEEAVRVEARILKEIQKDSRISPEAARRYAQLHRAHVEAMAIHNGMTPAQWDTANELSIEVGSASGAADALAQPGTEAFQTWFGDSKVVDAQGKPLVVYHGTDANFTEFRPSRGGEFGAGIYFTSSPNEAGGYAGGRGQTGAGRTMPVYLALKNPLVVASAEEAWNVAGVQDDAQIGEALRAKGYDGIAFPRSVDKWVDGKGAVPTGEMQTHYVVFDNTKIKSVNNRGTYSPTDPNILRQGNRGEFVESMNRIFLLADANASTLLHEMAHFWLSSLLRAAARSPNPQITKMADAVLRWFGVKDLATWEAMSFKEREPHHEAWAHAAEKDFFAEGKSPANDEEQRRAFRMFGRYVRSSYKGIKQISERYKAQFGTELPAINDEVRAVFDRMVASEDAISAAEAERALDPMLTEKPSDMGEAAWQELQQAAKDAQDEAMSELQAATLKAMRWVGKNTSKVARVIQRETRAIYDKVFVEERAKLADQPVVRAEQTLRYGSTVTDTGESKPWKLRLDEVREHPNWTDAMEKKLGVGKSGMLAVDGVPAEFTANSFGFRTAEDMVNQLLASPGLDKAAAAAADARMLKEHSDLMDPKKVQLAIETAIHSDARTKMVAAELKWLAKSTAPVSLMVRAAKQQAIDTIGESAIGAVKAHEHANKETFHRREALKALAKGDHDAARMHKRRELIESMMEREALRVQKRIGKVKELAVKLFQTDKKLAKSRNVDYVAVARFLASAFGLTSRTAAPEGYLEQLQKYNPAVYERLLPIVDRARTWAEDAQAQGRLVRTWKDLTVDEFTDLHEMLDGLWNAAKRDAEFRLGKEKQDLDTGAEELLAQQTASGRLRDPSEKESKLRGVLRRLGLLATRVENWCFRMDGGKVGAFTKLVWRNVRDRVNDYVTDRNRYTKRVEQRVLALLPKLKHGKIEFRDSKGGLLHTFGSENGGAGMVELIGALLHTGNLGNKRRLLVGRKWGSYDMDTKTLDSGAWDNFVRQQEAAGAITKEVWDFVQWVWDLNEELKPLFQGAHRDLYGFRAKEVEPTPVHTSFGVLKGGYMPATVDKGAPSAGSRASLADIEADHRKQFALTASGFTKNRSETFAEPLLLDLMLVPSHIDQVLRFSHLQPTIRDVEKLLKHEKVAPGLADEWNNLLLPWLQTVASQSLSKRGKSPDMDNVWRYLRKSVGVATMAVNVVNTLQQSTGLFLAATKVPPKHLFRALGRWMRERTGLHEFVAGESKFIADRQQHQTYEALDRLEGIAHGRSKVKSMVGWAQQHGYFLQSGFQNMLDSVVWTAAYEHKLESIGTAMEQDAAHAEAVQAADAAVRTTQGSFDPSDAAPYEVGTPFYRLFTMFTGYFNTLGNLHADQLTAIANASGATAKIGRALSAYLLSFALPALLADAISRTFRREWQDDDDDGDVDILTFDYLFLSQLKAASAEIPFGSTVLAPMLNAFDNQPWNDRMLTSPVVTAFERAAGGTATSVKQLLGLKTDSKGRPIAVDGSVIRDPLTLMGMFAGLPLGSIGTRAGFAYDVGTGEVNAEGADYWKSIILGPSRQQRR